MISSAANIAAARLFNRVLADYPQARSRLAQHAHAVICVHVGPLESSLRVTPQGGVEPLGESGASAEDTSVTLHIPLRALPALLAKEPDATKEVRFEGRGDNSSELAHTLSTIAQNVEWDIEEDLSQLLASAGLGQQWADIVSHRAVGTVKSTHAWRVEAQQRFAENLAEYLTHERNAFATREELDDMTRDNQTLRDDVARLEARLNLLQSKAPTT
ncbi:MAG: SCP2 domain-containing protein [Burkholderiales bacterium]|nr:hypothetical protein [Nitrosomonadaceae bacterium]